MNNRWHLIHKCHSKYHMKPIAIDLVVPIPQDDNGDVLLRYGRWFTPSQVEEVRLKIEEMIKMLVHKEQAFAYIMPDGSYYVHFYRIGV